MDNTKLSAIGQERRKQMEPPTRKNHDEPAPLGELPDAITPPKRGPVNPFALAALLIGSVALILASFPFLKVLTVILGGIGLVVGILATGSSQGKWKIGSIAGLSASLVAIGLGVLAFLKASGDTSLEGRLTQVPLRNPITSTSSRENANSETDWVDAGTNAAQQGDVRVRLISIAVGPVDFKEIPGVAGKSQGASSKSAQKRPRQKYLIIKLRISNAGAGRLIAYAGWNHPSPNPEAGLVSLRDGGGKEYSLKVFPGKEVVGQVSKASIPPTKWVDDVLVFDAPPSRVEFLRLELPGGIVGNNRNFRLQIPGRMIATRQP
jgi:hypothetical protein